MVSIRTSKRIDKRERERVLERHGARTDAAGFGGGKLFSVRSCPPSSSPLALSDETDILPKVLSCSNTTESSCKQTSKHVLGGMDRCMVLKRGRLALVMQLHGFSVLIKSYGALKRLENAPALILIPVLHHLLQWTQLMSGSAQITLCEHTQA